MGIKILRFPIQSTAFLLAAFAEVFAILFFHALAAFGWICGRSAALTAFDYPFSHFVTYSRAVLPSTPLLLILGDCCEKNPLNQSHRPALRIGGFSCAKGLGGREGSSDCRAMATAPIIRDYEGKSRKSGRTSQKIRILFLAKHPQSAKSSNNEGIIDETSLFQPAFFDFPLVSYASLVQSHFYEDRHDRRTRPFGRNRQAN